MIPEQPATNRLRDGFPGQRLRVLPRPVVSQALLAPTTSQLLVTDVGFFPKASLHGRVRPHGAPETIVIVSTAGRGSCRLSAGTHPVPAGHALIIPAGLAHRYEADEREPWTIWWMHVVGKGVADLLAGIGVPPAPPVIGLAHPQRVIALIDTIIHHMERGESPSELLAASGAAWHALALLAADRRSVGREFADPVEATIDHLRATSTRISVSELAGMAGLSESHFAARFRKETGYGVLEFQTRLRMGLARELLDTTSRTISSIAAQVGYPDPLYFSRQFRRIHAMSPSEYRSRDNA